MGGDELGGKTTGDEIKGIFTVGGDEGIAAPECMSLFRRAGRDFVGVTATMSDSLFLTYPDKCIAEEHIRA